MKEIWIKFLDKYFPRKFKVRVKHYIHEHYCIQWSNSRIFTYYFDLYYYLEGSLNSNTSGWGIWLSSYTRAEELAKKFTSKEEVDKYYAPLKEKRRIHLEAKSEWQKTNIPYKQKKII